MGICWYCHWGWSRQVADIYDEAVTALQGDDYVLHWGPSHVVWVDENFDEANIRSCLRDCGAATDYSIEEIAVVRRSLEQLLTLPESVRCPRPDDYDDENPEKYPPSPGMEMVKR